MDYVFTSRRKQGTGFGDEPGPTRFLAVPEAAEDTRADHQITKSAWVAQVMAAAAPGTDNAMTEGDVLLYVHGFNTPTRTMLERHRKIRTGLEALGFDGVVVSYDWPSAGQALNYQEDRKDAKTTAISLVDDGLATFAAMQRPDCRIDLHVLAHSMGCYVVREAFDDADDRPAVAARSWTVSQMILVAGDVSAASMGPDSAKSSSLFRHAVRVTSYFSPLDEVLSLSAVKRIGVAPRLGRVGQSEPLHPKAVSVYCGDYYRRHRDRLGRSATASHTWYFDDPVFYRDVQLTIAGEIDRHEFPTRVPSTRGAMALVTPPETDPLVG